MSKRLFVSKLMILAVVLMNMPVSQAQTLANQSSFIKISEYRDDPFVAESYVGRLDASRFGQDESGKVLSGNWVSLIEESAIFRKNTTIGLFERFAWNPWPSEARSNEKGNFNFADEARFPIHEVERDANGKVVLKDGLQVWTPRNLNLGNTTAFAAAHAARDAAEFWGGRDIPWGVDNLLEVEPHAFIDFNAFYSGNTRSVFFGVAPYRLPGETQVKMFETATSWELVVHEAGHAVEGTLKPNQVPETGYQTWSESFADQTAMWASLRDPLRVRAVLAETSGNLHTSNSLTRLAEAFAALVGSGTGIRDAFNDLKISDTTTEVHDRSRVLTGAVYKVFTLIYNDLRSRQGLDERAALTEAGDIMGIFLTQGTDYIPENTLTLEDAAKAYLKVDKELYGSRYQSWFVNEFIKRELFNDNSLGEWMAHEAAVPDLRLRQDASIRKVNKLVQANLNRLGIGPEFGLKVQSMTRDHRFGKTIVRVQLADGRGSEAALFENHGVLVFRSDGTLADYHSPLPVDENPAIRAQANVQAMSLVNHAKQSGLDQRGGLLSIVRRSDGQLSVEVRVMRSEGIYCWLEVFSLEHPEGERREVIVPTIPGNLRGIQPNGVEILTADDLNRL